MVAPLNIKRDRLGTYLHALPTLRPCAKQGKGAAYTTRFWSRLLYYYLNLKRVP